jgi:hypothetical protein
MRAQPDQVRLLKRRADFILLTADGVVPLDLSCPSSREALLGPAGTAYINNGIVVATDGGTGVWALKLSVRTLRSSSPGQFSSANTIPDSSATLRAGRRSSLATRCVLSRLTRIQRRSTSI